MNPERLAPTLLALVFALSALTKVRPGAFARAAAATEAALGSGRLRGEPILMLLIVWEGALAVALVSFWPTQLWAGSAALSTLLAFNGALLRMLRSGTELSCACFGSLTTRRLSPAVFVRNAVFLGLALLTVEYPHHPASGPLATLTLLALATSGLMNAASSAGPGSTSDGAGTIDPIVGTWLATWPPLAGDNEAEPPSPESTLVALLSPGCGGCEASPETLAKIARSPGHRVLVGYDARFAPPEAVARLDERLQLYRLPVMPPDSFLAIAQESSTKQFPTFLVVDPRGVVQHAYLGLGALQRGLALN